MIKTSDDDFKQNLFFPDTVFKTAVIQMLKKNENKPTKNNGKY